MTTKNIIFTLMVLSCQWLYSQHFIVKYESTKKTQNQPKEIEQIPDAKLREQLKAFLSAPVYYELVLQGHISLYKEVEAPEAPTSSNPALNVMVVKNESSGVYQDYKTKEYLSAQTFFGKDFFISDQVVSFDWKLTYETQQIGNYLCKKATTTYQDKEITAWYSEDIPMSVGPSIYNGLPGLIVLLEEGNDVYQAISVEKIAQKTNLEKPQSKGKVVTRDEFAKIRTKRF